MATTKKGNALPEIASLASTTQVMLTDSSTGVFNRMSKGNMLSALHGGKPQNLSYDNILIAFKESDDWTRMVHLDEWPSLQSDVRKALGVVVNYGGAEPLIVAPTGAQLYWSSAAVTGGGVMTTDRRTAIKDFNGEANTAAQIQKDACSSADYAPGFCAAYSVVNSNDYGYKAGAWWLPSAGELNVIWSNIHKINYALSLITGAEQIPFATHWSSTECSASNAWYQSFNTSSGTLGNLNKSSTKRYVRPVTAYK